MIQSPKKSTLLVNKPIDQELLIDIGFLLKDKYSFSPAAISAILSSVKDEQRHSRPAVSGGNPAMSEGVSKSISEDIARLKSGEPLAYVIGWVMFADCRIDLSHRPLIPRPETEWLMMKLIAEIKGKSSSGGKDSAGEGPVSSSKHRFTPLRALDLGCGSGCIGLSLLKHVPQVAVDFADIEPRFLSQAGVNAELNKISPQRYRLIQSNWFEKLNSSYDLIICNPPYVDERGEYDESLKHEPRGALFAEDSGLAAISKIVSSLSAHLRPSGRAIMEFGKGQEERVVQLAEEAHLTSFTILRDQYDLPRWISIESPKL